jgi:hypothetical protein
LGDADRLLKGGLALVELVFGEQHGPGKPVQFGIPKMLAGGRGCVIAPPVAILAGDAWPW